MVVTGDEGFSEREFALVTCWIPAFVKRFLWKYFSKWVIIIDKSFRWNK